MNFNQLQCRCGCRDEWKLEWSFSGEYELSLNCDACGVNHILAKSKDENTRVRDLANNE